MLVEWLSGLGVGYFLSAISFHPNILLAFLPLLRSFDIGIFVVSSLASYTVTNLAEHDRNLLRGGIIGLVLSCLMLFPFFMIDLKIVRQYSFFFLLSIISLYISLQNKKTESLFLFVMAGMSGIFFLNLGFDGNFVILSAFSGLFFSFGEEEKGGGNFDTHSSIKGTIASLVMSMFPAMSPNTSLAIFRNKVESYGSAIGATMLADCVFSLATLYLTGNPRIGVLTALGGSMGFEEFAVLLFFLVLSCLLMFFFVMKMDVVKFPVPPRWSFAIFFFLTLVFGVQYLITFLSCFSLGFIANRMKLSRSLLMGFLILPTLMIYV